MLAWLKTADGHSKNPAHYPEPTPLTPAETKAQKPATEYDVSSVEEMNEFLGWTDPAAQASDGGASS